MTFAQRTLDGPAVDRAHPGADDTEATERAAARPSRPHARTIAIAVHRYVGLAIALFVCVAGLTGSVLAWNHELDAALNPELFRIERPHSGVRPLGPRALVTAIEAQLPADARVTYVPLAPAPGEAVSVSVEGAGDDEYFVDPHTGAVLGSRRWGDIGQGVKNLLPFVYRLHYSLALDDVGTWLLGVVALLWTIDCFVALYLTLPPRRVAASRRPRAWLARWSSSWVLRTGKTFSFVFSWHRASGLWVWAMLLVFAWSSVALNLRSVYHPVMSAMLPMAAEGRDSLKALPSPRSEPALDWQAAHARGVALMADEARSRGFTVRAERSLSYDAATGTYRYRVRSTLDVSDRFPATQLWLDGDSGARVAFEAPTGQASGTTFTTWIWNLHWGAVGVLGLPYRVFVCVMGLAIAALALTGVWIWWRKAQQRRARATSP